MICSKCNTSISYGFTVEDKGMYCYKCNDRYLKDQREKKSRDFHFKIFDFLCGKRKQKEQGPVNNRFEILDL